MKRTGNELRLGTWAFGSVAAAACLVLGCNGEAPGVNPAPALSSGDVPDAGHDSALDGSSGADADAQHDAQQDVGAIVREVSQRDPWGPLDPSNMLHDGDFELSGLDAIQYPWLGIEQSYVRTGARCRTGLRCIEMPVGHYVIGTFVWPDAPKVEVSFYGKPTTSSQDCEVEGVGLVLMLDVQDDQGTRIGPETEAPVDGWCRYAQIMPVPQNPGYHYWGLLLATRSEATGPVVFDSVSMVGIQDNTKGAARALTPMRPADVEMANRALQRAKSWLPPNPPYRPTPVKNPTGRRRTTR